MYAIRSYYASPTTRPDWLSSKMTPHGTGIPSFQPAAIALAAGAGFIARGYSGDPAELTRLLVEAIQHRGFAFVQVLSSCVTFRPEQREWKQQVHPFDGVPVDDPVEAARIIQADDGRSTGLIYKGELPVWQLENQVMSALARLEEEFLV